MDALAPCDFGTGSFVEEPPVTENLALEPQNVSREGQRPATLIVVLLPVATLNVVLLPLRGNDTDEPPPESDEPVLQRDSVVLLPAELQ